jgi:hypothetical protein
MDNNNNNGMARKALGDNKKHASVCVFVQLIITKERTQTKIDKDIPDIAHMIISVWLFMNSPGRVKLTCSIIPLSSKLILVFLMLILTSASNHKQQYLQSGD